MDSVNKSKIFKYDKDIERSYLLHPAAFLVLARARQWAHDRDLPFVITSTVSTKKEDEAINRQTKTHRQGRAFDLSVQSWSTDDIDDFKCDMEKELGGYGAISASDLARRLIVVHTGTAPHIHAQIDASFSIGNAIV